MRKQKTQAWLAMLTLIITLFAIAAVEFGFAIFFQLKTIFLSTQKRYLEDRAASESFLMPFDYTINWIFPIQFLIADAIVIWRTWVLWEGTFPVYFPILLWTASLALIIAERIMYITSGSYALNVSDDIRGIANMGLACYSMSVATNAVSTAMIGFKAWRYRRFTQHTLHRLRPTRAEHILAILVESGLVYLLFWGPSLAANAKQGEFESTALFLFNEAWSGVSNHLVGMYPTMIVALVGIQRSLYDSTGSLTQLSMEQSRLEADAERTTPEEATGREV